MASTPQQAARAGRVEGMIALVAPVLDLVLTVGDRVSRAVGPEDEYYPIRSAGEAHSQALRPASDPISCNNTPNFEPAIRTDFSCFLRSNVLSNSSVPSLFDNSAQLIVKQGETSPMSHDSSKCITLHHFSHHFPAEPRNRSAGGGDRGFQRG